MSKVHEEEVDKIKIMKQNADAKKKVDRML
jgi:hypothetical protein